MTSPSERVNASDMWVRFLRTIYIDMPENFEAFRFLCSPEEVPTGYFKITGATRPPNYKTGKRAGQPNWKQRDRATERTYFMKVADFYEWLKEQGICKECFGNGDVCWKSNIHTGPEYRPCRTCRKEQT